MIAQVDLAVWDMATVCGSCHVGGSLVEQDLAGTRLSQRQPTPGEFNAIDHYVNENYNSATGLPEFTVEPALWAYPDPNGTIAPQGWGSSAMSQPSMPVADGQLIMPNVREMDCFMCHLEGYNNVLNSAAVQMGYFNAAPSMSAGLTNMFAGGAYIPGTVELGTPNGDGMAPATLSGTILAKLKPEPPTENCQQCHTPDNMADFNDMFEVFLSASPMEYNPGGAYASPFTGKAMPSYDLNAAFVPPSSTSYEVFYSSTLMEWVYAGNESAAGPFGIFPMALDSSWSMFNADGSFNTAAAGGGKPGMTGPLYYAGSGDPITSTPPDQNAMKKSTIPFPKADWFKRGDLWENELEVHTRLGCGGCHYNGESGNADLNQCDPGRGHVRMGGIESGKTGIDTRDTVKTCEGCHITGTSLNGTAINTYGAPNPTAAHTAAGLTANVTTARALDSAGNETDLAGNHLDVIDCTVCHIYKKTMAVRALDCTSGKRFPTLIGINNDKGMMGMFTDPMDADSLSDAEAIGAVNQNMGAMGWTQTAIDGYIAQTLGYLQMSNPDATEGDAARYMLKAELQEWQPIYGWHANAPKTLPDGSPNPDWRRKVIPINFITAQLWDDSLDSRDPNISPVVDANGDGGESAGMDVKWDPWISRDMKAGMNFGNTGFATVPTGFGDGTQTNPAGVPYMSAYNSDGTFTGAFQYVGIYGGNIILTTPEEIGAYKAWRNGIADSPGLNGRSWTNTQLVFQGGNPFQVTHNIAPTSMRALGKVRADGSLGCTDCHDSGSEFFSGGYDMTGTAVPATATIDLDGTGTMATEVASNMMQRPVVDYEVVALDADLRTGSEAKSKQTGAVLDVEFEEHGCWDGATSTFIPVDGVSCTTASPNYGYKSTTDLDRSAFLYPDLKDNPITLATKIATLEDLTALQTSNPASAGFGYDPKAVGFTCSATDTDGDGDLDATADTDVTFTAPSQDPGSFSYTWSFSDGTIINAASATRQFAKQGSYQAVLTVMDEEGKVARALKYVTVKAPLDTGSNLDMTFPVVDTIIDVELSVTALPAGYDRIRVYWGDGSTEWLRITDSNNDGVPDTGSDIQLTDPEIAAHTYTTDAQGNAYLGDGTEVVKVDVLVYQGTTHLGHYAEEYTLVK